MRISINEKDRGFHPLAYLAKVKFNGVEIKNCFTADEERGEAHCYIIGESGHSLANRDNEPLKEIKHGKVEIIIPEGGLN